MSYTPPNQNGQATSANSAPVVLSSEQQAILTNGTQKAQLSDSAGDTVDVVQLGTAITATDKGLVTNTVIHGVTTGGGGGYVDVKVTPSGSLVTETTGTVTANAGTNLNTSALALETTQVTQSTRIGDLTETAPTTDTASSGLNGRLQRISQRITSLITALGSPFQAGGSIGNTAFGVNNASGASAVNIQDGGNSITIDNTDITTTASNTTKGVQSTLNTSIVSLNNGQTFTGTGEQNQFPDVFVVCKTDQGGILYFDFSVNGTDWETFPSSGFTVTSGIQEVHKAIKAGRYFRVRFTNNSGSNQTYLRLYTYYGDFDQLNSPLTSTPSSDSDAITTKSVIVGQTDGGTFKFVGVDENGNLKTAVENPKTAFNELLMATPTPVAQISFEYGINTQLMTSSVTGTGTATTASSALTLQTGASASSSAQLISRRYLKYRAGQGAVGRGTMLFTTGITNSKQYAGIGNSSLTDGFFFGYNGATFGLFHINNGVETFVNQSSWNTDTLDGTASILNPSGMNIDPTKGNVWQIKYQYLGFGCVYFYIEHNADGEFTLVHILKYPNSNTNTSLSNPSLNLLWRAENSSNTSNITLKAGSGALFVEGDIKTLGVKNATDNNKAAITTLTNILTLRNATTYNTVSNRGQIRIKGLSVAYDGGNGVATLQLILNTTLGGTPVFATINGTTANQGVTITNGQSIASVDIAGTTITGGTVLFNTTLARLQSNYIDLSDLDIFVSPTETLTFAMKATTSGTCAVAVNWVEDI